MFDVIVSFFRSLFDAPQRDELLIPVRVEDKRPLHRRR
jgi:hypothetical protein